MEEVQVSHRGLAGRFMSFFESACMVGHDSPDFKVFEL